MMHAFSPYTQCILKVGFQETTTEIIYWFIVHLPHSQLKFASYKLDLESVIGIQIWHESGTSYNAKGGWVGHQDQSSSTSTTVCCIAVNNFMQLS